MLAALFLASVAPLTATPDPRSPSPRIYVIFEPVLNELDLQVVRRLRPDLLCRAWFKWATARDYSADAWVVPECHAVGTRLQGGVTVAAIYPNENGITYEEFLDLATRGPNGEIVSIGDWYHVALHNPRLREYVKRFVRSQIDAGADGIWFDEIEGIYGWVHEGYDEYATRAFTEFLRARYVGELGWAEDDPRFETELGINLERFGGTISGFDYVRWLAETPGRDGRPLAADPWQGHWQSPWESANPLYRLWGHAWSLDERLRETFQWASVARFWEEFVADAREYARERYGRELVITCNENGTPRPFVDFQQPHNGELPRVRPDGRLDATYTNIEWVEERVRLADGVTPGRPVVQFVDWPGETDRMGALSPEDLRTFLLTYIAEAYAGGALFAPPVRGYSYDCRPKGTLPLTAQVVDFLRRYDGLLFEGSRASEAAVSVGRGDIVVRVRELPARTVVHLIDHRPVEDRSPMSLTALVPERAAYAWTTALGSVVEREVEVADGMAVIGDFMDSALLVLEREEPAASGVVRDADGDPVEGARVTLLQARRTAVTGPDGRYAFAGAEQGPIAVWAEGCAPAEGLGPLTVLAAPTGEGVAGRFVDHLGCAAPCAQVVATWQGGRQACTTDVRGEFRFVVPAGTTVTLAGLEPVTARRASLTLDDPARAGFVELRTPPPDLPIGDFERGPLWTPNDSRKQLGATPVTSVRLVRDGPHGELSRCMEFGFAGLPEGGWANAYSQRVSLAQYSQLRFWYRGDGTDGTVLLALHVLEGANANRFYTFPLSLQSTRWRDTVVLLNEFRCEGRAPSAQDLAGVSVQLAYVGDRPLRGHTVRLHNLRAMP